MVVVVIVSRLVSIHHTQLHYGIKSILSLD